MSYFVNIHKRCKLQWIEIQFGVTLPYLLFSGNFFELDTVKTLALY
jgi:hypothetical protein